MMDDETTMASGSPAEEPVINVIEPDPPPVGGPQGTAAGTDRFDQTAGDVLAALRRREFEAERARLRDQAGRLNRNRPEPAEAQPGSRDRGSRAEAEADAPRWVPLRSPPEKVRKRYLYTGNQYFLKDPPYRLAFEDIGPYLVTEHNQPDIVESMLAMAQAKSWDRIRVSGHEAFRSEVWVQATLLGIAVTGYEPKGQDVARVVEARRERMTNRIDVAEATQGDTRTGSGVRQAGVASPTAPRGSESTEAPLAVSASADDGSRTSASTTVVSSKPPVTRDRSEPGETEDPQRHAGILIEHGGAPYQHNPARSDSYYVVYRDAKGVDHAVWGVDLERAVAESGAQPGQPVTMENLGSRLVTVRVPVFDEADVQIGEKEKDVYRNTWQIDVVGQERPADRSAETKSGVRIGRTRERRARTADGREDRPAGESPDRAVQIAVISEAMRSQGFGERSIARVQAHAEQLLDAFQAEGIPVPRPRVFDPKAPSTRARRGRAAPEQTPVREVERTVTEPSPPSL